MTTIDITIPVHTFTHFESKFIDANKLYLIEFATDATEEDITDVLRSAEGTTSTYDRVKRTLKVYHPAEQWTALVHSENGLVIQLGDNPVT